MYSVVKAVITVVKFRQIIKPGNRGSDVRAVKRAIKKMNISGSGGLSTTNFAGTSFTACIRRVQRNNNLKADGIYGQATHKIIAPRFDTYGRLLYARAKIRKPPIPATPPGDAQANAKKLLQYQKEGKYHADNSLELGQIKLTADGKAVWSQAGRWLHIDARVMKVLVWLIEQDYDIGTYAMCSDHHNDGPHGHSGGLAVDISSINGVAVVAQSAKSKELVTKVMNRLHNAPAGIKPRQLICDGYGGMHNSTISNLTIPNASFYGYTTMSQHRNHIHVGY
jgi:hypothetical protein